MYNPNDDPDVISGLCDDAKKEMATTPGPSHRQWFLWLRLPIHALF